MVIVSMETMSQWAQAGIVETVNQWFTANDQQTVSACATANNLSPQQVYWALWQLGAYYVMLPTQDTDLWIGNVDKALRP